MLALGATTRLLRRNFRSSLLCEMSAKRAIVVKEEANLAERPAHWTHPPTLPRTGDHGVNLNQSNPFDDAMPHYSLRAIGLLESVFREKNGTPRQGAVAPSSRARLRLGLTNNAGHALDGLQGFTYVWLIFMFSLNVQSKFNYKIKPPRLNGEKLGVFATRSPHRPNPIGLSLAKIEKVDCEAGVLHLSGVDLVHGTPILDVKPFLPMHDTPPGVAYVPEWIEKPCVPQGFQVFFSNDALRDIDCYVASGKLQFYNNAADLRNVIEQVLVNEPRSVYRRAQHQQPDSDRSYGFCIDILNVRCQYAPDGNSVQVVDLEDWSSRYTDTQEPTTASKPA